LLENKARAGGGGGEKVIRGWEKVLYFRCLDKKKRKVGTAGWFPGFCQLFVNLPASKKGEKKKGDKKKLGHLTAIDVLGLGLTPWEKHSRGGTPLKASCKRPSGVLITQKKTKGGFLPSKALQIRQFGGKTIQVN